MAVLGHQSIGVIADTGDSNYINAWKYTMPNEDGIVSSISVYVNGPVNHSPNNQFQLAVYTDVGDVPGALIVASVKASLLANSWNTLPLQATLQANKAYWLAYNTNGRSFTTNNVPYDAGGQSLWRVQPFGTFPLSFGAIAGRSTAQGSIYVTYTSAHAGADIISPSIPANLTVAATLTRINLTWSASTDNIAVTSYYIYRDGTFVGSSVTTSFADVGTFYSNKQYSYVVKAVDAAVNISGASNMGVVWGLVPATPSGSYNNLTNWPSTTNRPTVSGSTLSWIGPIGGGASTANDSQQSRVLTASAGNFNTTSNGQIIEGLDITGCVNINHNNVIMRQCRVRSTGDSVCVVETGGSGVVVEDCLLTNNGGTQQNGVNVGFEQTMLLTQNTLRRCNVFGFENHFPSQVNVLVIDNWFHAAVGPDCDMIELYGNPPVGGSEGIVCRHNTFDGRDTISGFLNSGVNYTNDFGGYTKNHTLDNNAFVSIGSTHDICDDNSHSAGTVSFNATNNGFFNSGGFRRDSVTCSPNSGNFIMATVTAISGSLCNGTGVI